MINTKDITIILQGAVDKQNTVICIDALRKNFPESTILLSTWEGTQTNNIKCDKIILNKDPGGFKDIKNPFFTNNLLRQLVSTQSALSEVNTQYCLKMRTDILLKSNRFLKYWDSFSKRQNDFSVYKHKIITVNLFHKLFLSSGDGLGIMPLPYHISDWFHFGLTEDIKKLYMIDLPKEPEQAQYFKKTKYPCAKLNLSVCSHQYAPEQYIGYNSFKKYSAKKVENFENFMDYNNQNIKESEQYTVNNFIILSNKEMDLECLKIRTGCDTYNLWCKYPITLPFVLWNGLYRPYIYRKLYKENCDNNYKIPLIIRLIELRDRIFIARGKKCLIL